MKTNAFDYVIGGILNYVTSDLKLNFVKSKWYLIVYLFRKMILAKP